MDDKSWPATVIEKLSRKVGQQLPANNDRQKLIDNGY